MFVGYRFSIMLCALFLLFFLGFLRLTRVRWYFMVLSIDPSGADWSSTVSGGVLVVRELSLSPMYLHS
jgi:hypothetical protein